MTKRSRNKRGPNRVNDVQMCLFDAQIALDAVDALTIEFARALNDISRSETLRPNPAMVQAYRILREKRAELKQHNARLAVLLAA